MHGDHLVFGVNEPDERHARAPVAIEPFLDAAVAVARRKHLNRDIGRGRDESVARLLAAGGEQVHAHAGQVDPVLFAVDVPEFGRDESLAGAFEVSDEEEGEERLEPRMGRVGRAFLHDPPVEPLALRLLLGEREVLVEGQRRLENHAGSVRRRTWRGR